MRGLDKVILQDIKGVGNNDQCTKDSEGYQEVGRRDKHYVNGDGRHSSDGKH